MRDEWLETARAKGVREEDVKLAYEQYARLFVRDEAIVAAGAGSAFFEPDGSRAAPAIVERIRQSLRQRKPLSLIRVGNGEGNAVSLLEQPVPQAVFEGFDFEFVFQNGIPIGLEEAIPFSRQVVGAIKSADIQGFRIGRFDEEGVVHQCLAKAELSPVFGLIYARWLFFTQLRDSRAQGTWFTNAWIHLDLIDHLSDVLDSASRVFIITGRRELETKLADRLGEKLCRLFPVPVQGYAPRSLSDSHYGQFEATRSLLKQEDLEGALVLVGAGMFGKVYCQDAKECGAVALDLGSAFDLLAGVATRPVHRQIDLAAVRW